MPSHIGPLAVILIATVTACTAGPTDPPPTWPVSPEPLAAADPRATQLISQDFRPARWALDPAFQRPGVAAETLYVLVWDQECSGGTSTTGRMSAPVIAYGDTTVTITIGVRPIEAAPGTALACPLPPGTPASLELAEPVGDRSLLDGGRTPPAPPSAP